MAPLVCLEDKMPEFKDDLTPKQEAFAKAYGKDLLSMTTAAAVAGYSDPLGEVDRLMKNRVVAAKVIEYLRNTAIKWTHLVSKSKAVLLAAMDAKKTVYNKAGEVVAELEDTRIRVEAARIVLMTLKKDSNLLEETAANEDASAKSNIELARSIVGPGPTREQ
jgi:phage terminase small subunit